MTEQEANGKRQNISRTSKLPQHGFAAIRPVVGALVDLAAASTKERIAEQVGVAPKGRFLGKLAAAGYYGFIEKTNGQRLSMTERGRAFLSGDTDEALEAQREGVLSTNFGSIVYLLRGQEPKEGVIAARVQDDVGVPASSAEAVAKTLISVSKEAQLIGENGRFASSVIEDTRASLEANGDLPEKSARTPAKPTSATPGRETDERGPRQGADSRELIDTGARSDESGGQTGPLAVAPVQVLVNLDASNLSPAQIAELVQALRTPPAKIS